MFNNIFEKIENFFKEVLKDIKKIRLETIFTDAKILVPVVLIVIVGIIVAMNLDLGLILKGLGSIVVFYFIFLWRK